MNLKSVVFRLRPGPEPQSDRPELRPAALVVPQGIQ